MLILSCLVCHICRLGNQPGRTSDSTPAAHQKRKRKTDRPVSPQGQAAAEEPEPWKTEEEPDITPRHPQWRHQRDPGPQVDLHVDFTPKDLFLLYFSTDSMQRIVRNTNKYAAEQTKSKKYEWENIDLETLLNFLGLLLYTSIVHLPCLQDYWKTNHIMSVPFPRMVMSRDRFRRIWWNIHLSDPEKDVTNDRLKGQAGYDKLFRIKPLYDEVRTACMSHYHPEQHLSVDERMVATKAKTGMTQFMKDKPTRWGMKLFVLADSSNGYTINFQMYTGKSHIPTSEHGVSYDAVMNLIHPQWLGSGYHIYMDNWYTSPKLFTELHTMNYGACGTYRENRKDIPRGRENAMPKNADRGKLRWIREGPLVYVKWMDTRVVSICSTLHPAHTPGDTILRKVKEDDAWTVKDMPCPTPIKAYNKFMGGVDLSDQLTGYYSTHRRAGRFYRTMFLHFVDIATTNAYIMHCEICERRTPKETPMSHKDFIAALVADLCGVEVTGVPTPINRHTQHLPVPTATPEELAQNPSKKNTIGRKICRLCAKKGERKDTSWKCSHCDVALCLGVDRNCFFEYHKSLQ